MQGVIVIETAHLSSQLVQLKRSDTYDLDPEVLGILRCRHIHLQMLTRLEAQVWTRDWLDETDEILMSILITVPYCILHNKHSLLGRKHFNAFKMGQCW